ncbi:rhodopsin-like [Panulirus ornatus]|uniref:rhodopsin-like n=1 Tax=Panulirus ornatus TaxID=150431 RepID=UPI003A876CB1
MADLSAGPHYDAFFGGNDNFRSVGAAFDGEAKYTNPYGNHTVVDIVPEDMLDLIDPHWYQFPPMNPLWYGLVCFFNVITATIAIIGNSTVIYVFSQTKSLRTPSNYFVINLAVSDFIMMFCMCPPLILNSYHKTWIFGPFNCWLYAAIGSLTGCCSISSMVLITLDRYNVIVKGIGGKPMTSGKAIVYCAIAWIMSAFWTFVPFFGWGRYVPEGNMTACGTDYFSWDIPNVTYLHAYAMYVYIIPFFIIVFCYSYIVKAVSAHERQMKEQAARMGVKSLRGDKDAQQKSTDCKLAKVALMTVSLWFMAWTPYFIINFAGFYKPEIVTPLFSIWGSVFAKANTIYNPIVYSISHPKYKSALYQRFPWLQCAGSNDDDDSKSGASTGTQAEVKA